MPRYSAASPLPSSWLALSKHYPSLPRTLRRGNAHGKVVLRYFFPIGTSETHRRLYAEVMVALFELFLTALENGALQAMRKRRCGVLIWA